MISIFLTYASVFLSEASNSSLANILQAATQMLQWFITSMGSLLTFITNNPLILVMFLVLLCGGAVGMLMRIWKSA